VKKYSVSDTLYPKKINFGTQKKSLMTNAYIYDAVRTPRGKGKPDGALNSIPPYSLLSQMLKAVKKRNNLPENEVEDVIMGCVTQAMEQGSDVAKAAVVDSGLGVQTSGVTLNRFCGSGLEAINQAAAYIMSGSSDLMIAGGVESMSRVPMGSDGGTLFWDPGFIMKHYLVPQGISADLIATKYGFSRKELDEFAVASHQRAGKAWAEGYFNKSVVPVTDVNGIAMLHKDELVKPNTNADILAGLKPAFQQMGVDGGFDNLALQRYPEVEEIFHVHHAGNSSAIVDGAAAVLLGSKAAGEKLGLKARAKIKAMGVIGTDPTIMLLGPAPVSEKVLKKAGMTWGDIDLIEVNEAFAAVPLAFLADTGADAAKMNVNGGAISMGHPLGATGAMILGTALDELERTGKSTALITLCIGGGMGIATIIER
jgi:acetyl-CoA C-acetyltransferase